ncbi:MAG: rhodanese-like domain-containing protein, partial [Desulfurellaceae bacterium]|nr:rhodanese-like domain-containing protein [Desulfurellaceae bacterium]
MRRYLKSVLLAWLAVVFVASLSYAWPNKGDLVKIAQEYIVQVTPEQLNAEISKAKAGELVILDVREPSEYKAGHIPYAKSLPRGLMEFKIAKLVPDKATPIVIYCKSGGRGSLA